jgi:hypothetical protein
MPVIGDLYRYTLAPLLGWAFARPMIRKVFAPSPVPQSFEAFPVSLSLRPSQLRAIGADTVLMIPGAFEVSRHYRSIREPVAIVAGTADRIVDVRQAKRLHREIGHSELHLVPGEGHMVHHLNPMLVAAAIDAVASAHGGGTLNSAVARHAPASRMSIAQALRIRERAHQQWCASGEPTTAVSRFQQMAAAEIEQEDAAYDKTVADSFPASDPPAHSGITGP